MSFEFPGSVSGAVQKDDVARKIAERKGVERGESAVVRELEDWLERSKTGLAEVRAKKAALETDTGHSPEARAKLSKLYDKQEQNALIEIATIEETLSGQTEAWKK